MLDINLIRGNPDLVKASEKRRDKESSIVDEVLKENQTMVTQYLSGKDKLLGFFVGQSMQKTKGKANPQVVNEILKKKLAK